MKTHKKSFKTIIQSQADGVATIAFNRPGSLNAVTELLYHEILQAFDQFETNPEIRVIILTGVGRAFCVGADLKQHGEGTRTIEQKKQYLQLANKVCERIFKSPKPTIAAVNGYALGAGAEMAISTDFLLMKKDAQIGFPEISIGTFVGGAVTHILPRLIGLVQAKNLILMGERISGLDAERMGLALASYDHESFQENIELFANQLAQKAPVSMSLAKQHLRLTTNSYDETLDTELDGILHCMTTRDWQEGVDAFAEKRSPTFIGK